MEGVMEDMDWKNFYIRYRWMPTKLLIKKFDIKQYDVNNFLRKNNVRKIFEGWRLSLTLPPERIKEILESAWEYYLVHERKIDFSQPKSVWIPQLLSLSRLSNEEGFAFLVSNKYLKIAFGKEYENFINKGYTAISFGAFHCFPKKEFLFENGVVPFMFYQTHKKISRYTEIRSMVEHVYMNFSVSNVTLSDIEKKENFIARYNEPGFVSSTFLEMYGIPQNFYKEYGLKFVLESIAQKYMSELGYENSVEKGWSTKEFLKKFPEKGMQQCRYCGLSPIDSHHLLPQKEFPEYRYHEENVVPLCVNVHTFITRGKWDKNQEISYRSQFKNWLGEPSIKKFDDIMRRFHEVVYGQFPNC